MLSKLLFKSLSSRISSLGAAYPYGFPSLLGTGDAMLHPLATRAIALSRKIEEFAKTAQQQHCDTLQNLSKDADRTAADIQRVQHPDFEFHNTELRQIEIKFRTIIIHSNAAQKTLATLLHSSVGYDRPSRRALSSTIASDLGEFSPGSSAIHAIKNTQTKDTKIVAVIPHNRKTNQLLDIAARFR